MAVSLIRKTSVIWWMLVLSGMATSCSSPAREADRAPAAVQDESVATDRQEQDAIRSYLGSIFQSMEDLKRYPSNAASSGLSGRVVLRFTVRWDGEIIDPQITEVSGHESFGNAALQTLKRVGQLPPFPDEIRRRELLVEVPITYRNPVDLSVPEEATGTTRELFIFIRWAMDEVKAAQDEAKALMEQGYSSMRAVFTAFQPFMAKLQSLAEEGNAHAQELLDDLKRSYQADLGFDPDAFFKAFSGNQPIETWRCFEFSDRNRAAALFSLFRMRDREIGEVSVAGTNHVAHSQVAGLNRRWDWGCDEKTGCRYAFSISPDGTGTFYDFSVSDDGRAKPSQVFECRLSP